MSAMLSVKDLTYAYPGGAVALAGVSLDIGEKEKWAVIGANGSGKSTLLQLMDGLRFPSQGELKFRGREVTSRSLTDPTFAANFRSRVGYVFQDADVQLFCPSVSEELLFGPRQLGLTEDEARQRVKETLALLEIDRLADRPPYLLSGGEKKRVALGSVLTMNPEILLLDEPMNGLDPRSQCFVVEILEKLHAAGKTLVLATHDLALVEELDCQTAVLAEDHRLVRAGPAQQVLKDTRLLLDVNLIHEHRHAHGQATHLHPHSHSGGHQHPVPSASGR